MYIYTGAVIIKQNLSVRDRLFKKKKSDISKPEICVENQ